MAAAADYAVLGAGAWGTALAKLLVENGRRVRLWARDPALAETLRRTRRNPRYLPGVELPAGLLVDSDLESVLDGAAQPLIAVPSDGFAALLDAAAERLVRAPAVVWATKGLDRASAEPLHRRVEVRLGARPMAVVSGPNFAAEVARCVPSATTVAANDAALAQRLVADLHNGWFRAYRSDDLIGVELAGALKNVFAIAAGIADGLGFGANTRAALLTRGLAELARLARALGGRPETLLGPAGVGDLILTCTDDTSRNRRFGRLIAAGHDVATALARIGQAVEGLPAADAACRLAARHGVELPITEQVRAVLYEGRAPAQAVRSLLERPPRDEAEV